MTNNSPLSDENTYVFDAESVSETTRLMLQDRQMTRNMGGPFSERSRADFSNMHDILDIACGPGGWVLDVAYEHPHIQVEGIDTSRVLIEYARASARAQKLSNAHFTIMNALQPLEFPDNAFDVVNARMLFAVVPPDQWPHLLQECLRITRPGGTIRLTEWEIPLTNSPAYERLSHLFATALHRTGRTFSPDGYHIGMIPMLGPFLRNLGCEDVKSKGYAFDFSFGTDSYTDAYENTKIVYLQTKPLITQVGLITEEEYDILYNTMVIEAYLPEFSGTSFAYTAWGKKPVMG
jgi:ubiquinone/menaquinone biosynthesis C-methylase UbiE